MGLGRHLVDDENSLVVIDAQTVQLDDDTSIRCRTSADAEVLRVHLAQLTAKPARRSPREQA